MSGCAARWPRLSLVTCAKRRLRLRYWMSEYENGKYYFFPIFSMVFPNLPRFYQAHWQLKNIHRRFPFFIPRGTESALLTKEQNTIPSNTTSLRHFPKRPDDFRTFLAHRSACCSCLRLADFSPRIQHLRRHCIRWALILSFQFFAKCSGSISPTMSIYYMRDGFSKTPQFFLLANSACR